LAAFFFQLHLNGDIRCPGWITTNQFIKFEQLAMELAVFIQQRCGCPFPSSNITTPQFTCHPSHDQHVTYRASISTGTLARQELVAALEEWPRVHRSILLQGERLSVDDTCPVIIQSLDEEGCEVSSPPVMVSSPPVKMSGQPMMVTLSTFLTVLVPALVFGVALGSIAVIIIVFSCNLWSKRR
jgi:hypothetical protein